MSSFSTNIIKTRTMTIGSAPPIIETNSIINLPVNTKITDLIYTFPDTNTGYGQDALQEIGVDSNYNTSIGIQALYLNETGDRNTALGYQVLLNNQLNDNTCVGSNTMVSLTNGLRNTMIGETNIQTGDSNITIGYGAFNTESGGNSNSAVGVDALSLCNGAGNIGFGTNSGTTFEDGSQNIMIGANSDVDSANATYGRIAIGYGSVCSIDSTGIIGDVNVSQVSTGSGSNLAGVTTQSTGIAPVSTPNYIGQIIVDTSNNKVYISSGTSSSDWILLN